VRRGFRGLICPDNGDLQGHRFVLDPLPCFLDRDAIASGRRTPGHRRGDEPRRATMSLGLNPGQQTVMWHRSPLCCTAIPGTD
jgi:hypothetical protein